MSSDDMDGQLSARHYLFAFAVVFLFWMLLAASFHPQEILAGLIVAAIVTSLAMPRLGLLTGIHFSSSAPWHFVRYLLHFMTALLIANLDMARRVLSPSLPIHPAMVEIQTELKSPLGKLVLANSITLTPGTLSVDVHDDRILVHWVDSTPEMDLKSRTRQIAEGFERHIRGFLY
jgi:multicomponent Na+:H+ antiporter subunit E